MWVRSQEKKVLNDANSFWLDHRGGPPYLLKCSIAGGGTETIGIFTTEKAVLEELDRLDNRLNAFQISEDTHG
ncbi:MAG: hypothetical protein PHQ43_07535 [Dehalococcoidales bacterium]|nr:hypothetical protein [Dehalococcoidales bacterium]